MKISDLREQWNINDPINTLSSPPDWYDKSFIELLARIEDIYNANAITRHEAEIMIASNDKLTSDILSYRYDNTALPKDSNDLLVSIMKKIIPIDNTFYRGVEFESQDDKHIMGVQSWATSVKVAKYFGDIIYTTKGSVKGVELSNIFYFNEQIYDHESNGLSEGMGEWLLYKPNKVLHNK